MKPLNFNRILDSIEYVLRIIFYEYLAVSILYLWSLSW